MVGGRDIGSALFSSGGILGLDVVPPDVRSVFILGGRRGTDTPGRSHSVCFLSTGRAGNVDWSSSVGWQGRGDDDDPGCVRNRAGDSRGGEVGVALDDELDCIGWRGGGGLSGTNAGAVGFNGNLGGKGAVSSRCCGGWDGPEAVSEGGRVNGTGSFVGGIGCTIGTGGESEGGVCEEVELFGRRGCGAGCRGTSGSGEVGLGTEGANVEECRSLPKTDIEVPPNTELAEKVFGADTRTENAFFGRMSGSCLSVVPNEEADPTKAGGIC